MFHATITDDLDVMQRELEKRCYHAIETIPEIVATDVVVAAKTGGRFKNRSEDGIRKNIIQKRISHGIVDVIANKPYARILEDGSKPHDIYPRNAEALRWFEGGGTDGTPIFAAHVRHPGTRRDPFMEPARKVGERSADRELQAFLADLTREWRG